MNYAEYIDHVKKADWDRIPGYLSTEDRPHGYPEYPRVPLPEAFVDERGRIDNLLFYPVGTVSLISSPKGALRSNHYHKTDWHFLYMLSGSALYFDRIAGNKGIPRRYNFDKGEMLFTPPGVEHAVLFLQDSVILQMAKHRRTREEHEADLVRVELLSREQADACLKAYVAVDQAAVEAMDRV